MFYHMMLEYLMFAASYKNRQQHKISIRLLKSNSIQQFSKYDEPEVHVC